MLEMLDIGLSDTIAYRIEGKITEQEMAGLLSLFREKINKGEKLKIYQEVTTIGGAELDAIIEKFRFFKKAGLSHFERIAVVTRKKWMSRLVDLEDRLFSQVRMKGFAEEEKDQAVEFLKNA